MVNYIIFMFSTSIISHYLQFLKPNFHIICKNQGAFYHIFCRNWDVVFHIICSFSALNFTKFANSVRFYGAKIIVVIATEIVLWKTHDSKIKNYFWNLAQNDFCVL